MALTQGGSVGSEAAENPGKQGVSARVDGLGAVCGERAESAPAVAGAGDPPGERLAFFDNLKAVLIFFVVLGHFLIPVQWNSITATILHDLIYLWHMPLFVFVTGLFAKSIFRNGRLRIDKILSTFALALLFQLCVNLVDLGGRMSLGYFAYFNGTPWFLVSLAFWYLSVPVLAAVRPVPALCAALAVALVAGCLEPIGPFMSLSRSIVYLPWFALGYYCTRDRALAIRKSPRTKIALLPAVAIVVACVLAGGVPAPLVALCQGDFPYASSGLADLPPFSWMPAAGLLFAGAGLRLLLYGIAALFGLAVFSVVPLAATPLSVIGQRTMPVYVLHRIIRGIMSKLGFFGLGVFASPFVGVFVLVAVSLALTWLCSRTPCAAPFEAFMRLKWSWLVGKGGRTGPAV